MLNSFDTLRRDVDNKRMKASTPLTNRRSRCTSSRLADALNLENEDPKLRDRYGRARPNRPTARTVARCSCWPAVVRRRALCTLAFSRWDWHGGNFNRARQDMPMLDQGLTALVDDPAAAAWRRMSALWSGANSAAEVNTKAGRDHWPKLSVAVLACGQMNHGQVIGASDKHAAEAVDRLVRFSEVFATLYTSMGINVETTTVPDLSGRRGSRGSEAASRCRRSSANEYLIIPGRPVGRPAT